MSAQMRLTAATSSRITRYAARLEAHLAALPSTTTRRHWLSAELVSNLARHRRLADIADDYLVIINLIRRARAAEDA